MNLSIIDVICWNVKHFPLDGLILGGVWVISIEPVGLGPTVFRKLEGAGSVVQGWSVCLICMYKILGLSLKHQGRKEGERKKGRGRK